MTDRERLREVFAVVDRADFLPPAQRGSANQDRAIHIGYRQTNSQPSTVAAMLDLLEVCPGHRVLDVGCGSGWTTALLGCLVGQTGEVYGVELVPELVAWSRQNLLGYPMPWVSVHQARPDVLGLPAVGPFDRILVSAEARSMPASLVDQLDDHGVMVVPVRGRMTRVRRTAEGIDEEQHGHYAFVPLIEPAP